MKYVILIACVGMLLVTACRKSTAVTNAGLSGTWELTRIEANLTQNYPAGNGNLLKFSDDGSYQKYTNGTLSKSGKFSIIYDTTATTSTCHIFQVGQFTNRFIFDSATNSPEVFFDITANNLTLVSGCFAVDAGSFSYYTKK